MAQKDDIIRAIGLAYQKPYSSEGTCEQEVQQYIRSIDFLEDVLQLTRTAFLIIECKRWDYVYCSSNANQVLGWQPAEFMRGGPVFGLTRLVPEDLNIQGSIHPFMVDYLNKLPPEEKPMHKFSFTSRITHKSGKEVNLLQHNFFLKWDAHGQPLLKMITFTDISAYKKSTDVLFYVTKIGINGKNEIVLQRCFSRNLDVRLTNRELIVVDAAASGLSNFAIAREMGITLNTVKNHKKNILHKLGCSNTSQMIALATVYGLISSRRPTKTGFAR